MVIVSFNLTRKVNTMSHRSLYTIAREIRQDWQPVNYAAKPYLAAMLELDQITEAYGLDTGKSVVAYFLSNATTWRGDVARRIKAELKAIAKATPQSTCVNPYA